MGFPRAHIILLYLQLLLTPLINGQTTWIDSLRNVALTQKDDSNKVWTLTALGDYYSFNNPDSGVMYAKAALALSEKLQFDKGIFWSIVSMDHSLYILGNYTEELDYALKARPVAKKLNDNYALGWSNGMLADSYLSLGDYKAAMVYIRMILKNMQVYYPRDLFSGYAVIVPVYIALGKTDSALICARKSYALLKADAPLYNGTSEESKYAKNQVYLYSGEAFEANALHDSALFYYRLSLPFSNHLSTKIYKVDAYNGMAKAWAAKGNTDSAIWYAKYALGEKVINTYPAGKIKAVTLLSDVYESQKNNDSSLKYLKIAIGLRESIFNREKTIAFQNSLKKEEEKQTEIRAATTALKNRYLIYSLIIIFVLIIILGSIFIRNKRIKQLQEIRNSIADDLHDDIGSALSSISIMNELAKEKSPAALSLLASIGESTVSIQENMSDIIWAIKTDNDSFENVLQRMNQFAFEMLEAKNIALDFTSDPSLGNSRLTMEQRKNVYLFFKEVINNAAKHAAANRIGVYIKQSNRIVEMTIKDNGKGFDPDKAYSGNGMGSLRKRAAELKASFTIRSCIGNGTDILLSFKIT